MRYDQTFGKDKKNRAKGRWWWSQKKTIASTAGTKIIDTRQLERAKET